MLYVMNAELTASKSQASVSMVISFHRMRRTVKCSLLDMTRLANSLIRADGVTCSMHKIKPAKTLAQMMELMDTPYPYHAPVDDPASMYIGVAF